MGDDITKSTMTATGKTLKTSQISPSREYDVRYEKGVFLNYPHKCEHTSEMQAIYVFHWGSVISINFRHHCLPLHADYGGDNIKQLYIFTQQDVTS